jgi:hypothetical protein
LYTWTDWQLKEGAAGAGGEKSPQKKTRNLKEGETSQTDLGKNNDTPIGYSERAALRREQYDM